MSDVLRSLVERARGMAPVVRPVVGSLYGHAPAKPFEVVEEVDARASTPEPRRAPEPVPGERDVHRAPHPKRGPEPKEARAKPKEPALDRVVEHHARRSEHALSPPEAETTTGRERPPGAAPATPLPRPVRPRRSHADAPRPQRPRAESRAVETAKTAAEPAPHDGDSEAAAPLRPVKPERPRPTVRRRTPALPAVEPGESTPEIRERLVFARERAATPPTVHISIGRVELRAAATAPRPSAPQLARPKQTLDDYLRERSQRSR